MRIPSYNRKKLSDVWNSLAVFKADYESQALQADGWDDICISNFYYIIMGKWANNIIANYDVNQFKYKVWGLIHMYGGRWKAMKDMQIAIIKMDDEEIKEGDKSISNHANNPSNPPSTGQTGELSYVDDQNVIKRIRGPIEALQYKMSVLQTQYNEEFFSKFESLFTKFCPPYLDAYYITDEEEEEEEEQ